MVRNSWVACSLREARKNPRNGNCKGNLASLLGIEYGRSLDECEMLAAHSLIWSLEKKWEFNIRPKYVENI